MRITVIPTEVEGEAFKAYYDANGFKKSTLISRRFREHIENSGFKYQPSLFSRSSAKRNGNENQND